jgi:hypothetical protein
MERVAFLIEDTQERLGCMLNPETVQQRRRAGLVQSHAGRPGTTQRSEDAWLCTGGGTSELELDVLFDVQLAGSSVQTQDVRDLTGPLWRLAENRRHSRRLPLVRFIWGKHWNLPGVIAAVAERLDRFTAGGAPQRSWLRLRMLRVDPEVPQTPAPPTQPILPPAPGMGVPPVPPPARLHTVLGAGPDADPASERLDVLAQRHFGHPAGWRLIAAANGVPDPLRMRPGQTLRLPLIGGAA